MLAGVLAFGDLATGLFNPAIPLGLYLSKFLFFGSAWYGPASNELTFIFSSPHAPWAYAELLGTVALVTIPFIGAVLAAIVNSYNTNPDKPAALITEGIGTFLIILCQLKAPGSAGLVYISMVYFGAHVSFSHYNPAITLAHYLAGRCSLEVLWKYASAQTCGALLAGVLATTEGAELPTTHAIGTIPLVIGSAEVWTANEPSFYQHWLAYDRRVVHEALE